MATDQGKNFMSSIMRDLCKLLQIKHLKTEVYHSQTDGLVEWFNRTLRGMMWAAIQGNPKDWDQVLPPLLFSVREAPQASLRLSPFELVYRFQPQDLLDIVCEGWKK